MLTQARIRLGIKQREIATELRQLAAAEWQRLRLPPEETGAARLYALRRHLQLGQIGLAEALSAFPGKRPRGVFFSQSLVSQLERGIHSPSLPHAYWIRAFSRRHRREITYSDWVGQSTCARLAMSQAMLTRLEHGEQLPSVEVAFWLRRWSRRRGVPITYDDWMVPHRHGDAITYDGWTVPHEAT